ncbi:MAG TPA: hypothetical protein VFZ53_04445 [Polyangiaceae bacterium]
MARPPQRSSFPSLSGETRLRRLGVGPSGGGDRPLRAQLVVAGVACVILFAVPLYLLRRPSSTTTGAPEASASASSGKPSLAPVPIDAGIAQQKSVERVRLGPAQRVKCGSSPAQSRVEGGLCDSLPAFEQALKTAILAAADCAPKEKTEGSINYVMSVDFTARALNVFPGASGSWRGPQAKRSAQCVMRAVAAPDWGAVPHQYRYYWIAVSATYPSPSSLVVPGGTPTFE